MGRSFLTGGRGHILRVIDRPQGGEKTRARTPTTPRGDVRVFPIARRVARESVQPLYLYVSLVFWIAVSIGAANKLVLAHKRDFLMLQISNGRCGRCLPLPPRRIIKERGSEKVRAHPCCLQFLLVPRRQLCFAATRQNPQKIPPKNHRFIPPPRCEEKRRGGRCARPLCFVSLPLPEPPSASRRLSPSRLTSSTLPSPTPIQHIIKK